MTGLLIVEPMPFTVAASRGTGAANLASADPKEVWADAQAGSAATLTIDLGEVRTIDTVLLGYVRAPAIDARWTITGGVTGAGERSIQADDILRVPDAAGSFRQRTHALWTGAAVAVRYLALTIYQPAGSPPLTAGVLVIGKAWTSIMGREWGPGRQPIDGGSVTALSSGGFAVVEGARKSALSWTFGDLSVEEAGLLEGIADRLGVSRPGLVIEDAARTAGLASRIHYGVFGRWKPPERRNRTQTRWDIAIEQWT
ncbi:hypothetical protein [Sphingomonas panni]|uniref:hypothetical protein n=1 Tax=Sphingomonas panni TaxID=237612 RepID=UPI001F5B9234|nr:hypothetical protein [Sphingomonas panni]